MHLAGAITSYVDVAQLCFWAFFLGFLALVYYLRREDKREGYPLESPGEPPRGGFPEPPGVRTYVRFDGTVTETPHHFPDPPISAKSAHLSGDPAIPIGSKLTANLGPSTYVMRRDVPFRTVDGEPQVQPMRVAHEWSIMEGDADPRGMRVMDVHYLHVGVVTDVWVDRGTKVIRYLEVELDPEFGESPVLLPIFHTSINEKDREIRVTALRKTQFATVPKPKSRDLITAREEDMVNGYYAGGRFYMDDFTPEATQ